MGCIPIVVCTPYLYCFSGEAIVLTTPYQYETVAESPVLYLECQGIAHPACLSEVIHKPFPYREYSSYPAEGKVPFP